MRFFFFQTNLIFKSNPVFVDILVVFASLFTFSTSDFYLYSTDFEVLPMPLRLFIKTNKVLMRFNVLFVKFSSSKCSCLIFHEKFLPVNMELLLMAKITPDVNNDLLFVHAVQELHSSLHGTHNFWCLIMASNKLM